MLDIDASIKPLYGRQEGAELGYNSAKPGRPRHTLHAFWVGNLRLVLDVQGSSGKQLKLDLAGPSVDEGERLWEYAVMVTYVTYPLESIGQLYRDRADCESGFDELKNQWGLSGFTTKYINRCQTTARACALVYNWWGWYCRTANPSARHTQSPKSAPTSRVAGRCARPYAALKATAGLRNAQIQSLAQRIVKLVFVQQAADEQIIHAQDRCGADQISRPVGSIVALCERQNRPCHRAL